MNRPGPKRHRLRHRAAVVLASLLIHVLIVAGVVWSIRLSPDLPATPAIVVTLLRGPFRPIVTSRAGGVARVASHPISPRVAATAAPARGAAERPPAPPAPLAPTPPVDDGLSQALRGVIGCTDGEGFKLSAQERQACEERFARLGAGGPTYDVATGAAGSRGAIANEAGDAKTWHNYRQSRRMDDYPGLRTLFGFAPLPPPAPAR